MNTPKRTFLITALVLIAATALFAQDPVHFTVAQKQVSPTEVDVVFTGKIDNGWHVYSPGLPADGPISASITTEKAEGAQPVGKLQARGKEISTFDKVFEMNLRYYENSVTFVQRYKITGKKWHVAGFLEYGTCNDEMCMPPGNVEFDYQGDGPEEPVETKKDDPAETEQKATEEKPAEDVAAPADTTAMVTTAVPEADSLLTAKWWQPSGEEIDRLNGESEWEDHSLLYMFLAGLLGGVLALFTPCVWPIIPMTVSFFLKRAKNDRRQGVRDALTYGAAIVVIYVSLGLAVTALFGASKLNELSTNAVFNIFFCLLLVVFALSFFGMFELTLPSSWSNKIDAKAGNTTGLLSIFLMAFTLALVSFSCTGPVIGALLVECASQGKLWGPAIGMLGFAIALALPFTIFALFPTLLKAAPRSGGWMNTIKVVLGFIELAFALKFFSVADLAYGWRLLDREVFLCLWIVIFGALGLYLVGMLKFQSDVADGQPAKPMPVACIMLGLCSLAFAIYMVPGLWGAPCKAVSAFAPPVWTQDFNLYKAQAVEAQYTNYEEGMAAAKAQGKPVMLDFTGFGCVNCRKMEAAVWTDPQVAARLNNDFVLISLFVDDKTPLDKRIEITENGQKRTLRTVGDKWSYLQRHKFNYNAQPFYVILDNDGHPLAPTAVYKEDIPLYMNFLNTGLDNSKNKETAANGE